MITESHCSFYGFYRLQKGELEKIPLLDSNGGCMVLPLDEQDKSKILWLPAGIALGNEMMRCNMSVWDPTKHSARFFIYAKYLGVVKVRKDNCESLMVAFDIAKLVESPKILLFNDLGELYIAKNIVYSDVLDYVNINPKPCLDNVVVGVSDNESYHKLTYKINENNMVYLKILENPDRHYIAIESVGIYINNAHFEGMQVYSYNSYPQAEIVFDDDGGKYYLAVHAIGVGVTFHKIHGQGDRDLTMRGVIPHNNIDRLILVPAYLHNLYLPYDLRELIQ